MSSTEQDTRFEQSFPAPEPREYQKGSVLNIVKAFEEKGVDVVEYNAPTGSGKSIVLETAVNMMNGDAFITTPLNILVDQMETDEFMSDRVITLKGRNNYDCIHPRDRGTRVDEAVCQRDSNFDCELKLECPYYGRKWNAIRHPEVVTNMAYILAEGLVPRHEGMEEWMFSNRKTLVLDECQNVEDQALNFISVTVSHRTCPEIVWSNITIPDEEDTDDMDFMAEWLREEVMGAVSHGMQELDRMTMKSKDQAKDHENLQQFSARIKNFIQDVEENEWVAEYDVDFVKRGENREKVVFKPVYVDRFLENLLWERAEQIILSSATIPIGTWREEIGLKGKKVTRINVPSTFPVENRPIICNHAVGKMVSEYSDKNDNRKTNAWDMAQKIQQITDYHVDNGDNKGFVHCRSYGIAKLLKDSFSNHGERQWFMDNVLIQDRNNREKSLYDWLDSDKPLFFSVYMSEGVDLKYDKCNFQVLAKTLYPYMTKRMKRRKEIEDSSDFWNYYNRKAVIQLQQAYGRGVRAEDDECVFYILDESANKLIQMNAEMFNSWFLEAIDDLAVDPSRGI